MPDKGESSPRTLPGRWERSEMPATVTPSPPRASTTAAPPSLGEHSMNRVSGGQISRDASTSSAVTALRNMASGLATP